MGECALVLSQIILQLTREFEPFLLKAYKQLCSIFAKKYSSLKDHFCYWYHNKVKIND